MTSQYCRGVILLTNSFVAQEEYPKFFFPPIILDCGCWEFCRISKTLFHIFPLRFSFIFGKAGCRQQDSRNECGRGLQPFSPQLCIVVINQSVSVSAHICNTVKAIWQNMIQNAVVIGNCLRGPLVFTVPSVTQCPLSIP